MCMWYRIELNASTKCSFCLFQYFFALRTRISYFLCHDFLDFLSEVVQCFFESHYFIDFGVPFFAVRIRNIPAYCCSLNSFLQSLKSRFIFSLCQFSNPQHSTGSFTAATFNLILLSLDFLFRSANNQVHKNNRMLNYKFC